MFSGSKAAMEISFFGKFVLFAILLVVIILIIMGASGKLSFLTSWISGLGP
jgi:hypothetical protein